MKVEKQFDSIKKEIDSGELTEFRQLFDYLLHSWMRTYLQTGYKRISRLEKDPGDLTISEVITLGELIKVDPVKVSQIAITQVVKNNKKKKKK
jgi:hypothetical protein